MIDVTLDISLLPCFEKELYLFSVDLPKSYIEEVQQAIQGEIHYNGTMYNIGGLIYEMEEYNGRI